MDFSRLAVQLVVALLCAGAANFLVPRRIPGKFFGLILIGLAGVWVGEWSYQLLRRTYGIDHELLRWHIQNVQLLPAVIGCAMVLYIVTSFLKWGRYSR